MVDSGLENKVKTFDKVSSFYYGKDFTEADLAPGSEVVFALNKDYSNHRFARKTADLARAGVVEALKICGYVAAGAFICSYLLR